LLTLFSKPVTASNCSLSSKWSLWKAIAWSMRSPAARSAAATSRGAGKGAVAASIPTWAKKGADRESAGSVRDDVILAASR
jgi:hypothetical protein